MSTQLIDATWLRQAQLRRAARLADPDRDLAHEADMAALQREQLRGDIGDEELESEDQASIDDGDWDYDPVVYKRSPRQIW